MKNTLEVLNEKIIGFETDLREIKNLQNFKFELETCGFIVTIKDTCLNISMGGKKMESSSILFVYAFLIPRCKTFSIKIQY